MCSVLRLGRQQGWTIASSLLCNAQRLPFSHHLLARLEIPRNLCWVSLRCKDYTVKVEDPSIASMLHGVAKENKS